MILKLLLDYWIESEIDSDFYSKAEVDRKDSELAARFESEIGAIDVTADIIASRQLIFEETSSTTRLLAEFRDSENAPIQTVRSVSTTAGNGSQFQITIATFTPTLRLYPRIARSGGGNEQLNWDEPAAGFSVDVINPADFTSKYITAVNNIVQDNGEIITDLTQYTASTAPPTNSRTATWEQSFTVDNPDSYIRPFNATGSETAFSTDRAGITVNFSDENGDEYSGSIDSTSDVDVTYEWENPTVNISASSLGTNTLFLSSINHGIASMSVSNIAVNNAAHTLSSSAMSIADPTISGSQSTSVTFNEVFHKNATGGKVINSSTVFSRPASVAGVAYSVTVTDSVSFTVNSNTFRYPGFYLLTDTTDPDPTRDDLILGNNFDSSIVNMIDNGVTNWRTTGNTSIEIDLTGQPGQKIWFGIRGNQTQPTDVQVDAGTGFTSINNRVEQIDIDIQPDDITTLPGYQAEVYTLHGFTIGSGITDILIL